MKSEAKNKTMIYHVDPLNPEPEPIEAAAAVIRRGGTVAFPTETVYGLGANALSAEAVTGIFQAKGRPSDNPLIVHVAAPEECLTLADNIPPDAYRLMERFWPGPLTLVLPKRALIPDIVTAGLATVGIRMPDHPVALALLRAAQRPIAAPSANLSGHPSPTTGAHVIHDLRGRVDIILDSGETGIGLESTVLDLTSPTPVILRPGGVTREMLLQVLEKVDQAAELLADETIPRSPGMKYRHYAPQAPMQVVVGNPENVQEQILALAKAARQEGKSVGILTSEEGRNRYPGFLVAVGGGCDQPEITARRLYALLRWLDEQQVDLILAEGVSLEGLGSAIMNRLCKAAGYNIIRVEERSDAL